jgi:hypothetical protein
MLDQAITTLHDQVVPGVVAARQRIELLQRGDGDAASLLDEARSLLDEVATVSHRLLSRLVVAGIVELSGSIDLTDGTVAEHPAER